MLVTMDRAGRVVIPKSVRDGMGLRADEAFELVIDGAAIRLELVAPISRLGVGDDGLPVLRAVEGIGLNHGDVRALRDGDQR